MRHLIDKLLVDHPYGLGRFWGVYADYFGLLHQLMKWDLLCPCISFLFDYIVTQNGNVKALKFFGQLLPGISITDYTDGFSFQLPTAMGFPQPLSCPNGLVSRRNFSNQSQQQTKGMFAHSVAIAFGCSQ